MHVRQGMPQASMLALSRLPSHALYKKSQMLLRWVTSQCSAAALLLKECSYTVLHILLSEQPPTCIVLNHSEADACRGGKWQGCSVIYSTSRRYWCQQRALAVPLWLHAVAAASGVVKACIVHPRRVQAPLKLRAHQGIFWVWAPARRPLNSWAGGRCYVCIIICA